MDGDARLSSSFGAAAVAYAEHRPDYAGAAVRWALEAAPGRRVLDLGAGTGKLTAGLLALGAEVTAVEPDPEMLGELRRALPDVRALAGGAEAIPLPDGSVDAVVAGNAMHWFDMDVAGPEIARVLAPGGTLAGLWNVLDDRVDWIAGLAEVSGPAAIGPRDTPAPWRAETAAMHLPTLRRPVPVRLPRAGRIPPRPAPHRRLPRRDPGDESGRPGDARAPSARTSSAGSAPTSRAARRPPTASSPCRCSPASCACERRTSRSVRRPLRKVCGEFRLLRTRNSPQRRLTGRGRSSVGRERHHRDVAGLGGAWVDAVVWRFR